MHDEKGKCVTVLAPQTIQREHSYEVFLIIFVLNLRTNAPHP